MAAATFQAEGHIYTLDGRIVPSVTQVLTLAGLDDVSRIPRHHLAHAAAIGTAVHQACEFLDEADLDLDSLDPEIVGYVLGYQKFKQEQEFVPAEIERRGISKAPDSELHFGFCLDRIGIWKDAEVLIDIKTASRKQSWWGIQTAAYAQAVHFDGLRMSVHVSKDGDYKVVRHEEESDFAVWRGALEVAHFKLANGARIK